MAGIDRKFSAPKGISDALPHKAAVVAEATSFFSALASLYGYSPIETPLLEKTEVFERSVGDTSDIVTKQMYTFEDKGGDSLTLRPEGTAGVVRAFVEHEVYKAEALPWRVYYIGDMFRYERPQAGRYRQFKQVGAEALGAPEPEADVEQIEMCLEFLGGIGVASPKLVINSIGDSVCRPSYVAALGEFLASAKVHDRLCEECRQRSVRNPLRVLDCKKAECKKATEDSPRTLDFLCEPCRSHFEAVRAGLEAIKIEYRLDPRLVRGLDYYTRTAFEVISGGLEAAQDAVAGGGRYDGLVELFGGPPTPAVGFAVGVDRSLSAARLPESQVTTKRSLPPAVPSFAPGGFSPDVIVVEIDESARDAALLLASRIRREGLVAFVSPAGRSLKSQMKHADRAGAAAVAVLGPEELSRNEVAIRLMFEPDDYERKQVSIRLEDAGKAVREMLYGRSNEKGTTP
jgi:histidyl-tRNA synthetase